MSALTLIKLIHYSLDRCWLQYLGVACADDPFALSYCHFALNWSSFDFVERSFETVLGPVPLHRFHSVATHWAIAAAASSPSELFAGDSSRPSHFCSLSSSPIAMAIADDVAGRSTSLSWVAMDSRIHCVAFVAPLDGMTKRNPYSRFASHLARVQPMVALPFVRALEALKPNRLVAWVLHSSMAAAFAVAVDLVRCPVPNAHAATMDYSSRFVAALALPAT